MDTGMSLRTRFEAHLRQTLMLKINTCQTLMQVLKIDMKEEIA